MMPRPAPFLALLLGLAGLPAGAETAVDVVFAVDQIDYKVTYFLADSAEMVAPGETLANGDEALLGMEFNRLDGASMHDNGYATGIERVLLAEACDLVGYEPNPGSTALVTETGWYYSGGCWW